MVASSTATANRTATASIADQAFSVLPAVTTEYPKRLRYTLIIFSSAGSSSTMEFLRRLESYGGRCMIALCDSIRNI